MLAAADVIAGWRVMSFRRFQQMIAVAMSENSMLSVDEETTSSSQRPSAHLEKLNGWVRCEDEVLVSLNEHKNDNKGPSDYHSVSKQWNGCWCDHGA